MTRPFDLIAPPHTPFHADGRLNLSVVEKQAEHYLATGITGAFVAGTTGESQSLTVQERLALAQRWCDVCRGTRLEVIVQVGANCVADAVLMASHARNCGADAIATLAPSFLKPQTVDDLIACCQPVAAAAPDLPFYLYDIPALTSVRLPLPEFLEKGAQQLPNLKGLKYTNPDLVMLLECLHVGEFDILFGCDEMLLSGALLGCRGAVGTTYNFAAEHCQQMVSDLRSGQLAAAAQAQFELIQLIRVCQQFGFLAAAKALMTLRGIPCGPVRVPVRALTADELQRLYAAVEPLAAWRNPASVAPPALPAPASRSR